MRKLVALADRTAVLFLGVAAGAAIGFAFGRSGEKAPERPAVKPVRIATANTTTPPATHGDAPGFECALPFQQHLLDTVATGKPVTVGVFGDSFGDGVWSALYRLLPAQQHFRVLKYSQQSTGFTRYSSLNLEDHAQAQLAADGPVDVAVISFGANDTQGVYSGGHAAALMSPEWQRVIGERVDRFVALMRARGAMVYWVGLPKMRKASFDDDISAMNEFYTARMKALRVPFIDIKPLTVDEAGEFTLYLPDPVSHERRLLRANDGIHMSMNGYVVITRGLAERIMAYVRAAKVVAGVSESPPVPKPLRAIVPVAAKVESEKHRERHADELGKRDEGEHESRRHHDDGDEEKSRPAKHDDADKPPRARDERDKERPKTSGTHDGESKDRAPKKSSKDAKPRSNESQSGDAKSGETKTGDTKPASSRSGEPDAASGESKHPEHRVKAEESKSRSTEDKAKSSDTKRKSTDTKPRADTKAKSDDTPPRPHKHRDEPPPSTEGNNR